MKVLIFIRKSNKKAEFSGLECLQYGEHSEDNASGDDYWLDKLEIGLVVSSVNLAELSLLESEDLWAPVNCKIHLDIFLSAVAKVGHTILGHTSLIVLAYVILYSKIKQTVPFYRLAKSMSDSYLNRGKFC